MSRWVTIRFMQPIDAGTKVMVQQVTVDREAASFFNDDHNLAFDYNGLRIVVPLTNVAAWFTGLER